MNKIINKKKINCKFHEIKINTTNSFVNHLNIRTNLNRKMPKKIFVYSIIHNIDMPSHTTV